MTANPFANLKASAPQRNGPAFSNSTEFEIWSARWCDCCVKDDGESVFCPILNEALLGETTPFQWARTGLSDYTCSEFVER